MMDRFSGLGTVVGSFYASAILTQKRKVGAASSERVDTLSLLPKFEPCAPYCSNDRPARPGRGEVDALSHGVRESLAADWCGTTLVHVEFNVDHHLGCQRFELAL